MQYETYFKIDLNLVAPVISCDFIYTGIASKRIATAQVQNKKVVTTGIYLAFMNYNDVVI